MLRIFRHYVSLLSVLFMFLEFMLFFYANAFIVYAVPIYRWGGGSKFIDPYLFSLALTLVQISFMWSVGLYRLDAVESARKIAVRTFIVLALSMPLFAIFFLLISRSIKATISYTFAAEMLLAFFACWAISIALRAILHF